MRIYYVSESESLRPALAGRNRNNMFNVMQLDIAPMTELSIKQFSCQLSGRQSRLLGYNLQTTWNVFAKIVRSVFSVCFGRVGEADVRQE